jgi:hypothetical protein
MFFIISLLNYIKNDENIINENYEIVKEINRFLETVNNEKTIENMLNQEKYIKEFLEAYILNLKTAELDEILAQTNNKKNEQETKKEINKKNPEHKFNLVNKGGL